MKRYINIMGAEPDEFKKIQRLFDELGIPLEERGKIVKWPVAMLGGNDPRYGKVIDFFARDNYVRYSEVRVYTKKELAQARLLTFVPTFQLGEGGRRYGTEFDFSTACKSCGTGWRQTGDLIIDKKQMKKHEVGATYLGEVVVAKRVATALLSSGLTGFKVRPVRHKSKWASS